MPEVSATEDECEIILNCEYAIANGCQRYVFLFRIKYRFCLLFRIKYLRSGREGVAAAEGYSQTPFCMSDERECKQRSQASY